MTRVAAATAPPTTTGRELATTLFAAAATNPGTNPLLRKGSGAHKNESKWQSLDERTIYRQDGAFDPFAVFGRDASGREILNIERLMHKLAPRGRDGRVMQVHHVGQEANGSLAELLFSQHKTFHGPLHSSHGSAFRSVMTPSLRAADRRLVWGSRFDELCQTMEVKAWLATL